jgi:hypothetical protein
MLLMMAEVLEFSRVSAAYPTSQFWKILAYNQTHVEWFGCSLHIAGRWLRESRSGESSQRSWSPAWE